MTLTRPYAFSVIEAKETDDPDANRRDRAHDALEQAVSEAVGLTKFQDAPGHLLALPVVVTEAELFRLAVPEPDKEDLQPVDWYRIRWHGAQAFRAPTVIDVVRRSYLSTYAKDMRSVLAPVAPICADALRAFGVAD